MKSMLNFRNFFKKNSITKVGLDEALEKGLITKEEFLRLKEARATQELLEYLKTNKTKK